MEKGVLTKTNAAQLLGNKGSKKFVEAGGMKKVFSSKGKQADAERSLLANNYVAEGRPNFGGQMSFVSAMEAARIVEKADREVANSELMSTRGKDAPSR